MSKIVMPEALKQKAGANPGGFLTGLLQGYAALEQDTEDFTKLKNRVKKFRDLSVVELMGDLMLVIACDSNAGCGEKPKDHFRWPYEEAVIGMFKVPMMEVLAAGATPVCVINNLCVEMEPTGKKIIKYMRQQMEACGMDPDTQLTGSTEDNATTCQTGVGMTVIGIADRSCLRLGSTKMGDAVVCVGNPQGGPDSKHRETDPDIASVAVMQKLCALDFVHEILPCGSHGVRYEALELAKYTSGVFHLYTEDVPIRLDGSAGASTGVIVSLRPEDVDRLRAAIPEPVVVCPIGTIENV